MKFKFLFEGKKGILGYILEKAEAQNIDGYISSRTKSNLRLKLKITEDPKEVLERILGKKIKYEDSDISCSGTFKTYKVTLLEDFEYFKTGTFFYFVPLKPNISLEDNFEPELIMHKQLIPERVLGKNSGKLTKEDLYNKSKEFIEKELVNPEYQFVKKFIFNMIDFASDKNTNFNYENAKNVSGKDKVRILKDFGEILCALYAFKYFKNNDITFVEFPTRANEPLIDFKCYSNDKVIANVSVKSGTSGSSIGASPSVNSIGDLVQEAKKLELNKTEQKYLEILDTVSSSNLSVLNKILETGKLIDSKAIDEIKDVIGSPVSVDKISNFCKDNLDYDKLHKEFEKFYEHISKKKAKEHFKKESVEIMQICLKNDIEEFEDNNNVRDKKKKGKTYSGFVLSPLARYIVKFLNTDDNFLNFLSGLIRKLDVLQCNITFNKSFNIEFKDFKEQTFKFYYSSNAADPGRNNFGFKMV